MVKKHQLATRLFKGRSWEKSVVSAALPINFINCLYENFPEWILFLFKEILLDGIISPLCGVSHVRRHRMHT